MGSDIDKILDTELEDYYYETYGEFIFNTYITTLGIEKNKDRRLTNKEVDRIVSYIQKYESEYLKSLLIFNFMGLFIYVCKKYIHILPYNSSDRNKIYVLTEDLVQDCILVLDKCIYRYEVVDRGSFKAYMYGEVRNKIIDNMLKKYFEVVKVPVSVYRSFRKQTINSDDELEFKSNTEYGIPKKMDNDNIRQENLQKCDMGTNQMLSTIDRPMENLLGKIKGEINNDVNFIAFCLINGINCEKQKAIDVARTLGLEPSTLSHRMRNVREKLKHSRVVNEFKKYFEMSVSSN